MNEPWSTSARFESSAPLGLPVNAAVYIMSTAARSSVSAAGIVLGPAGQEGLVAVRRRRRRGRSTGPSDPLSSRAWRRVSPISASWKKTTAGSLSAITKANSAALWRQLAGQNTAPSLAAASRPSRSRWQFCPSHSRRSPAPTPARRQGVGELVARAVSRAAKSSRCSPHTAPSEPGVCRRGPAGRRPG